MKTFEELRNEYLANVKKRFAFLWERYEKADIFFQSQAYRDIESLDKIEKLQNAFRYIQVELEQISNVLSNDEMTLLIDEYESKKVP